MSDFSFLGRGNVFLIAICGVSFQFPIHQTRSSHLYHGSKPSSPITYSKRAVSEIAFTQASQERTQDDQSVYSVSW
ncbi:hypothetical protein I7I53_05250 [Histoplasma capsulatum var. duboisii H88]|uniref:Uncharacterized protein n=1 Tax=Ajellomyces capsulatus (strain H88) TaxID=544711 RepID=A0A8A1LXL2_AJEC8|nr:hypothetical protein I7I53_05250 [Histoplasma capsulatum var. duboisii H88]